MKREAIHIENLDVKYDMHIALRNVSLNIYENDYIGIIGPNGGGKTTLIKAILGFIKPSTGFIEIFGKPLDYRKKWIAYVPQVGIEDRSFPMTVMDMVLLGLLSNQVKFFHRFSKQDYLLAHKALEQVGISHLKDRHISQMSGGEYQKAMIARAIVQNPRILLLDEPTANVDQQSRADIYELLRQLNSHMTILMVTHDTLAISTYVKDIACLDQYLVFHGAKDDSGEAIEKMYNCPIDILAHGSTPHRVLRMHPEEKKHD